MAKDPNSATIATNRRARHHYAVLDTVEAGVVLVGTEVKALRDGRASLVDSFATVDDGEIWLRGLHIGEYSLGTWTNHAPLRVRKLLLHRREIDKLALKITDPGLSLVPLSMYFSDGRVKVELALVRGKKTWDKRQDLATRDANREIERAFARHIKGRKHAGRRA
ncbi:SsrA-binding protein [Actinokineospora baliensis]|uniref:SsrA-binding protein SmpB n=1 Tax=Actinokineospora baliensis TaxID=547056 RepID=UPI00195D85AC|nr:SsrA-binding protein SmpB [Actinokineospora baliensis]MBM7772377.1 SsrA-binding protein [Actinokineospora baliensis]